MGRNDDERPNGSWTLLNNKNMRGKAFKLLDDIRYCTTKLIVETKDGELNIGTGFFFDFNNPPNNPLLITNKHVVEDWKTISLRLNKADEQKNPLLGDTIEITLENKPGVKWMEHPDADLCAILVRPKFDWILLMGQQFFFKILNVQHMPSELEKEYIGPIEEVLMIGYPDGLEDTVHNLPLVRKGITATDFQLDYNGKREFVIDAPIFSGSSGSPVFLCNMGGYSDQDGRWQFRSRLNLLGILCEYGTTELKNLYKQSEDGEYELVEDMASTGINNLGFCAKAECLLWFRDEMKRRGWS